jgi:hypothetical protein
VTAAAHELAANAVMHGARHGQLRLWVDGEFMYFQVSGDGAAVPADEAGGDADGAATWPAEHGHRLWSAGSVADVGIGRGVAGTIATGRFRLSRGRTPRSPSWGTDRGSSARRRGWSGGRRRAECCR